MYFGILRCPKCGAELDIEHALGDTDDWDWENPSELEVD